MLPPQIKIAYIDAFYKHAPRRLVCSQILTCIEEETVFNPTIKTGRIPIPIADYILNLVFIKELVLTDPKALIPTDLLYYWRGLEKITFLNGHQFYEEKDGIIYADNGTTLVFVPPCHPQLRQGTFRIPEGIRRLGDRLFKGFDRLKRVEMPDSVCEIGLELFDYCLNLEYVRFSDSITRLPAKKMPKNGWGTFLDSLFHSCDHLTDVHLPKNLVSIGEGVFCHSGITKISLPEGVEELESNSFRFCYELKDVFLPKSLKRVGENAFVCTPDLKVWAYEGTAKGLLSSFCFQEIDNIAWIHVLDANGQPGIFFPVPQPYFTDLSSLLSQAWDGDHLCLDPLFKCIPHIHLCSRTELIQVALCHLDKKSFQPYVMFRKRSYTNYGIDLIKRGQWDDFCSFLKLAKPHRGMRKSLLDYCNETGNVRYIPPLLEMDQQLTKGKGRASLERKKYDL